MFEVDEHKSSDRFATRVVCGQFLCQLLVVICARSCKGQRCDEYGSNLTILMLLLKLLSIAEISKVIIERIKMMMMMIKMTILLFYFLKKF